MTNNINGSDFNRIVSSYNDDSNTKEKGEAGMKKVLGSVFNQPIEIIGKKTSGSYTDLNSLFGKYAGDDNILQAEEIQQMKSDFEFSGLSEIYIGGEKYNVLDANKPSIDVENTKENDIIFGNSSGEKKYSSAGGNDLILDVTGTAPNSVKVLGQEDLPIDVKDEKFVAFRQLTEKATGKKISELTEAEYKAAIRAFLKLSQK